jgi:CheY-like chemotaxis protein
LVDDDADDRELFDFFFAERPDIKLLPSVCDGIELIKFLENTSAGEALPELIILDQNMPRMNGVETLKFLKSTERYGQIPSVIYSTYVDNNLIAACAELGVTMVAAKPLDNEGYQKMMDDFLSIVA